MFFQKVVETQKHQLIDIDIQIFFINNNNIQRAAGKFTSKLYGSVFRRLIQQRRFSVHYSKIRNERFFYNR